MMADTRGQRIIKVLEKVRSREMKRTEGDRMKVRLGFEAQAMADLQRLRLKVRNREREIENLYDWRRAGPRSVRSGLCPVRSGLRSSFSLKSVFGPGQSGPIRSGPGPMNTPISIV